MKEENKKTKKENKNKEPKKENKAINTIKKKWLINGTKTFLLIAIIIAIFITINIVMKNMNLSPIDLSQEKLYTLSEETKNKVKDVEKDVKIYFVGYPEEDSTLDLAKQFENSNEKITAEAIDINKRPDIATKYGIESGSQGIIVESGEKSKTLTSAELTTYDTSSGETISIAEEKLASGIISVTVDKIPKVYFLNGYSGFSLSQNMQYLGIYLANEVTEIDTLDILTTGKVPDDCDALVITTPNKDFDDIATNAIIEYINLGRNILWFNTAIPSKIETPNINKILALYGVNPFDVGVIRETDSKKMVSEQPNIIVPDIEYSKVTKKLYNSTGALLINATKINLADEETLTNINVQSTPLMQASYTSYFRTNFSATSNSVLEDEQKGTFLVGAELDKTIKKEDKEVGTPAVVSKMIIYGENYFISDASISSSSQYGAIQYAYNKDVAIDSIAYLVDREEDITTRKSTGTVTYTATKEQDAIIQIVIFAVPILIIIIGIVIWQVRRRKK